MQFVVNKTSQATEQYAVEADSAEKAEQTVKDGSGNLISRNATTSFSVQPRPQALKAAAPAPAGGTSANAGAVDTRQQQG